MLFNSIQFLLFFSIVFVLYFSIPHRFRWVLLLISSYYFYMSWKPEYIILIMISTLVDYIAGIQIHESKTQKRKKIFLGFSILSNIGMLFGFKYFNFFSDSFRDVLSSFSIPLDPFTIKVLLPIGISFYTFQTLSYTIDVYRGQINPQRHLGIFAVYVSFFPQLVAGPIERAKNLLPQFFEEQHFDYQRITDGLKLMLWGFFKKVVIADRLAIVVNTVYGDVGNYTSIHFMIATFFFAFQIYCDFSGYSDIAIGSSQVFGIRLMDNFKRPYFSRSISEFWKRWHISLTTWFKDYLYIPLGGNRVSTSRWYLNIFTVFLVSGLWHGAAWTFVIWGTLHGLYMLFEAITKGIRHDFVKIIGLYNFPKFHQLVQILITFIVVNIGWVFFRANSLSDAVYIITHLFKGPFYTAAPMGSGKLGLVFSLGLIAFMESIHMMQEHVHMRQFLSKRPIFVRWPIYMTIILLILLFGVFNDTEFIYFQF